MERIITINGREVRLKPSANFMRYYQNARLQGEDIPNFQADLKKISGLDKHKKSLESITEKNAFDVMEKVDLFEFAAIIRRMVWTFAYCADKNIKPYENWSDELTDYDISEASQAVMALVEDCFFLTLGSGKGDK